MTPSSQADAQRFRKEADECHELAEKAMSPQDKEAWLQLAEDWLKLAPRGGTGHEVWAGMTGFRRKAKCAPNI
jgi:hypothetical protein